MVSGPSKLTPLPGLWAVTTVLKVKAAPSRGSGAFVVGCHGGFCATCCCGMASPMLSDALPPPPVSVPSFSLALPLARLAPLSKCVLACFCQSLRNERF